MCRVVFLIAFNPALFLYFLHAYQLDTTVISHKTNSIFNIAKIETLPITSFAIPSATRRNKLSSRQCHYAKQGWPNHFDDMLRPYCKHQYQLTMGVDCFIWGIHMWSYQKTPTPHLQKFHRDLSECLRMKTFAHRYVWWPGMDKDIENMAKFALACPVNKTNISDQELQVTWTNCHWQWTSIHAWRDWILC